MKKYVALFSGLMILIGLSDASWDRPNMAFISGYSWWDAGNVEAEQHSPYINKDKESELMVSSEVQSFVVQLNTGGDDYHETSFKQIFKSLDHIGDENVKFEVIAYGDGLVAMLEDNEKMFPWVMRLVGRGVEFKVCQMTMLQLGFDSSDFPIEVDYVESGAAAVIKRRMEGYMGWTP